MLLSDYKEYGNLKIIAYTFENVGDLLPMHNHAQDKSSEHITIVSRGSFLLRGAGWEKIVLAGAVIDFLPDQWHEFEAIEQNAKLVNVRKFLGDQNE